MAGLLAALTVVRLGVKDLETRFAVDRVTIWRWCKAGRFPPPHYIADRRCWLLADIEKFEAEEMARPPAARRGAKNLNVAASAGPPAGDR